MGWKELHKLLRPLTLNKVVFSAALLFLVHISNSAELPKFSKIIVLLLANCRNIPNLSITLLTMRGEGIITFYETWSWERDTTHGRAISNEIENIPLLSGNKKDVEQLSMLTFLCSSRGVYVPDQRETWKKTHINTHTKLLQHTHSQRWQITPRAPSHGQ